jgi:hypothetical protein
MAKGSKSSSASEINLPVITAGVSAGNAHTHTPSASIVLDADIDEISLITYISPTSSIILLPTVIVRAFFLRNMLR